MKVDAGLKWNTDFGEDAFLLIYNGYEVEGILDLVSIMKESFGKEVWFPVVFMMPTGLRTSEAILCLNKIADDELESYYNPDMGVLEHFKDKRFIRKTKKAFVSVINDYLLSELQDWHKNTTFDILRKRLERKKIPIVFYDCRRWFNTTLRQGGLDIEIIDLLCGRLPRKVFLRSYFRPEPKAYFEKTRITLYNYSKLLN